MFTSSEFWATPRRTNLYFALELSGNIKQISQALGDKRITLNSTYHFMINNDLVPPLVKDFDSIEPTTAQIVEHVQRRKAEAKRKGRVLLPFRRYIVIDTPSLWQKLKYLYGHRVSRDSDFVVYLDGKRMTAQQMVQAAADAPEQVILPKESE